MKILALSVVMLLAGSAWAQSAPSMVQDEHDKRVKADAERATKYHNNADDYPKSNSSAPNIPTPAARIPATPKMDRAIDPITAANDARVAAAQPGMARDFAETLSKANSGDVGAILDTARHYRKGYGTPINPRMAYETYMSIAARDGEAAFQAADMIFDLDGKFAGVSMNDDLGYALMKLSANRGNEGARKFLKYHPEPVRDAAIFPAMESYGDETMAARGVGVTPTTAATTAKLIADLDKRKKDGSRDTKKLEQHKDELLNAGKAVLYGVGVPSDIGLAGRLLAMAESGGAADATEYIHWGMWMQTPAHPRNVEGMCPKAGDHDPWHATAAASYQYALCSSVLGARNQQRKWLMQATMGSSGQVAPWAVPQALRDLGMMMMEGDGGEKPNATTGLALLKQAAERGNRSAQYSLGMLYERGSYGVARDEAMAGKYFQQAAAAGSAEARAHLQQTAAK